MLYTHQELMEATLWGRCWGVHSGNVGNGYGDVGDAWVVIRMPVEAVMRMPMEAVMRMPSSGGYKNTYTGRTIVSRLV